MKHQRYYILFVGLVASLGGLLFGYDTAVIAGAEQSIQLYLVDSLGLSSFIHGLTVSSALAGCIIGAVISGVIANSIGRRNTLIIAAVLFFLSALGSAYPEILFFTAGEPSLALLITFNLYRILGGIGVGLASAIAPVYISEMSPPNIRGKMVVTYNMSVVIGQTVVYVVTWFIVLGKTGEWINDIGWRYMFASELIPAAVFFILLLFIPETPRYMALKHDYDKAYNLLEKINGSKQIAGETLQQIKHSLNTSTEKVSLFYYGKLVLFVGFAVAVLQQFIGINIIMYYAPRIFANLGADASTSMFQTIFIGAIGVLVSFLAIKWVEEKGRKFLLLFGSAGCAICLTAVAALFFAGIQGISTLIFILGFVAAFQMTWGPITWVVLSELFPNRIRGQAVAVAVTLVWGANLIASSTFPPLNDALGAGAFLIYGLISTIAFFFVLKFVPETKNKSLEEIEEIWLSRNKSELETKGLAPEKKIN
ncbi:MFS transporter, SP family, xylose:H+ symportor [Alteribacillus persepolensis]|uniref:MFS transporter, SP family, xylose:H+ symportor n=1 Tax=Alteribacillus persepolensis TaxID=568899 RepID=A0A1G8F205_9BACI|nr:sugar porter family MFS transporter [Alteribacillus persepolensis]SDH76151.1 MFS transporter, SP family, xylose:H+ symportor [Alteribacillus persepolensis]